VAQEGERNMPERTWSAAIADVRRSAARHKLASGVIAACIALSLAAIGWAGTSSGAAATPATDPVASAFSLPVLTHSGVSGSGDQISLRDYAGKPLIVNFFASWCPPCKKETPLLAAFYRSEHGKVALVGIDENDVVGNATKFIESNGVTYPVGWDPDVTAAGGYDVAGLPQTFFLNARHRIVDRILGAVTTAELTKGIALATGGTAG
jgi:cytochrome c biogenesis protein CcmG, thiol:disulfide interchange protein DsbE